MMSRPRNSMRSNPEPASPDSAVAPVTGAGTAALLLTELRGRGIGKGVAGADDLGIEAGVKSAGFKPPKRGQRADGGGAARNRRRPGREVGGHR